MLQVLLMASTILLAGGDPVFGPPQPLEGFKTISPTNPSLSTQFHANGTQHSALTECDYSNSPYHIVCQITYKRSKNAADTQTLLLKSPNKIVKFSDMILTPRGDAWIVFQSCENQQFVCTTQYVHIPYEYNSEALATPDLMPPTYNLQLDAGGAHLVAKGETVYVLFPMWHGRLRYQKLGPDLGTAHYLDLTDTTWGSFMAAIDQNEQLQLVGNLVDRWTGDDASSNLWAIANFDNNHHLDTQSLKTITSTQNSGSVIDFTIAQDNKQRILLSVNQPQTSTFVSTNSYLMQKYVTETQFSSTPLPTSLDNIFSMHAPTSSPNRLSYLTYNNGITCIAPDSTSKTLALPEGRWVSPGHAIAWIERGNMATPIILLSDRAYRLGGCGKGPCYYIYTNLYVSVDCGPMQKISASVVSDVSIGQTGNQLMATWLAHNNQGDVSVYYSRANLSANTRAGYKLDTE